jgi:hypothetical protein
MASPGFNNAGSDSSTAANTATLSTANTSSSFTPPSGSLIIVKVATDSTGAIVNTPTGGGLVFTQQAFESVTGHGTAVIYSAPVAASPGLMDVVVTMGGSASWHSMSVEIYTNATLSAIPQRITGNGTGLPQSTIQLAGYGSFLVWLAIDTSGKSPVGATFLGANSSPILSVDKSSTLNYVVYYMLDLPPVSPVPYSFGITSPSSQTYCIAALELLPNNISNAILIQNASNYSSGGGTSLVAVFSSNSTVGDLIVLFVLYQNSSATIASIADTQGNLYSQISGPTDDTSYTGGTVRSYVYYAVAKASSANSITVTLSTTITGFFEIDSLVYRNVNTYDASSITAGTSASPSSGSITTTGQADLLIGYIITANPTPTLGTGSTFVGTTSGSVATFLDVQTSSSGSYALNFGANAGSSWTVGVLAFYNNTATSWLSA